MYFSIPTLAENRQTNKTNRYQSTKSTGVAIIYHSYADFTEQIVKKVQLCLACYEHTLSLSFHQDILWASLKTLYKSMKL